MSVFSNCESVELFHKGKSLGRKNRNPKEFPAAGLNWDILFDAGENLLVAEGYMQNKLLACDTLRIQYSYQKSGSAAKIVLSSMELENGNVLIEAQAVDKAGKRVLDYEERVYFSKDGPAELLINYGTPSRSQVVEMANGRASIELIPFPGKTTIEARNQNFKGSYLTLNF